MKFMAGTPWWEHRQFIKREEACASSAELERGWAQAASSALANGVICTGEKPSGPLLGLIVMSH
jgi:hypothetical protein